MPIYEYTCRDCGHRFEELQRLGDSGEKVRCPVCGRIGADRQLSTFAAAGGGSRPSTSGCGRGGFS